ncbi:MAG TPA: HAD hydrolase-like protein [Burkholderiaceae bacterium]
MARRVVVFDLDGTLSNPLDGFARSINHALRLQGLPEHEPQALARYIGPPLYESAVELTGSDDPTVHNRLIADYRHRYGESGFAENTLYDGIPEVLHALRDAGATLGLCTSKRVDFAEAILRNFGLRELFAFVSGGDIGVHKWQQLQALREAGAVDADSVMVGDRDVDITSAHRNGLLACGVLWGFGSREELQAESPRHLAETPADLRRLAQAW